MANCLDPDDDNDGLEDSVEVQLGTGVTVVDSDGDGLFDNEEDTDGDGVSDYEALYGKPGGSDDGGGGGGGTAPTCTASPGTSSGPAGFVLFGLLLLVGLVVSRQRVG